MISSRTPRVSMIASLNTLGYNSRKFASGRHPLKPFSYVAPTSLDEAYKVLAQADGPGSVRAIVGGSDLIDQMKQERRTPSVVMDVKRIPEMNRLEWVASEGLHLGAATNLLGLQQRVWVYEDAALTHPLLRSCLLCPPRRATR